MEEESVLKRINPTKINLDIHPQLKAMLEEYAKAIVKFSPMASPHEGYAVMLEEFDELWDEIKKSKPGNANRERIRKEAIQVAAMAYRFLVDCCDFEHQALAVNRDEAVLEILRKIERPFAT